MSDDPQRGVVSYGAYLPYHRLQRSAISGVLGTTTGTGTRAVASYDEDTTSMGVEAARLALAGVPVAEIGSLYFATSDPAYQDKTNATTVHAALGLGSEVFAGDVCGAVRSGVAALRAATGASEGSLAVLSDRRGGLPGGQDEREGGDGAAAFVFGDGAGVLAEVVGYGSSTEEFLERWRTPGEPASHLWEERFGEHVYVPHGEQGFDRAMKSAGVAGGEVDRLAVTGTHSRAVKRVMGRLAQRSKLVVDDLTAVVGNTGTAHPGILLAGMLDTASPGELLAVVVLADGVDVMLFRTTAAIAVRRSGAPVAAQVGDGDPSLSYATYLTWRGLLHREPPRRPDPVPPAAPPAFRHEGWKFAFAASRCRVCGTRQLPPQSVCRQCGATGEMDEEGLAGVPGTIATFTVDRLAFSLAPPVVVVVVDLDGGGRFECELTDADPDTVSIGDRVEMTFRCLSTTDGIHNYFWKARPIRWPLSKEVHQ